MKTPLNVFFQKQTVYRYMYVTLVSPLQFNHASELVSLLFKSCEFFKMSSIDQSKTKRKKIDSINLSFFLQEAGISVDAYFDLQQGLENHPIAKKRKVVRKSTYN